MRWESSRAKRKAAVTARTLKALKESIAHWDRHANGTAAPNEGIRSSDCSLCSLFVFNFCKGCPVAIKTQKTLCRGTPWREAAEEYYKGENFKVKAKEMADFLRGLLPKGKKK